MSQVELSGNGIPSSQHLQDFRNIPASQWEKKKNTFCLSCFLVKDDSLGADTQNSSCAAGYSIDQGWVKLRARFLNLIAEAMVLKVGPFPLSTTLSWAFWELQIITCTPHTLLRNTTQEWMRLFLRLGCSSGEIWFFRIDGLLPKILGVEKFPPRPRYRDPQWAFFILPKQGWLWTLIPL